MTARELIEQIQACCGADLERKIELNVTVWVNLGIGSNEDADADDEQHRLDVTLRDIEVKTYHPKTINLIID